MEIQIQDRSALSERVSISSRWHNWRRSVSESIRAMATRFGSPYSSTCQASSKTSSQRGVAKRTEAALIGSGSRIVGSLWLKSGPARIPPITKRSWRTSRFKVLQKAVYACLSGQKEIGYSRMIIKKSDRHLALICMACHEILLSSNDECRCTRLAA